MSIAAYLQTELVALSNEARRKHPEIKEAAERVIALLRHPGQGPGSNLANVLSQNQDVLKPFLLACDTKNVKLVTISMGCLRELISHRAMPEGAIEVVLRTLNGIMSHGVEIQLKMLQTILPLLTNYNVHGEYLAEDSRVVFVNNTAAATLRQLVIYIFEKVGDEDLEKQKLEKDSQILEKPEAQGQVVREYDTEEQLGPCALDAYLLFQDLCLLTNSEHARFLKLSSISRTFGLELIESVLTNHFHLFKQHTEFASLLRERVCPLIIKNFSDKHDFPQTMRLMRVVYILIKQFHEILGTSTDIFGDMIIAIGRLSTEKPLLIGAGTLVQDSSDTARPTNAGERDGPDSNVGGLSIATSTMRIQCVDQLDKADPPQIPETYLYYLSLICINSIADGLASYIFPIVSQAIHDQQRLTQEGSESSESATARQLPSAFPNTNTLELSKSKEADDIALVTVMAESAWPGLLAAFSFFLGSNLDEELFHNIMRAYQNFTSVCGVLQLNIPRDAFLTSLCKNCLPVPPALEQRSGVPSTSNASQEATAPTITEKNMYCLRILLNVAQYLGGTLFDSWYLILETMQQAEHLLTAKLHRGSASGQLKKSATGTVGGTQQSSKSLPASSQVQSHRPSNGTIDYASLASGSSHQEADVLALLASFKQLFDLSTHLDLASFRSFTGSLCKLGATGSGLPLSDAKGAAPAPFLKGLRHINKSDDKSFAIDKLRYVCLLNVDRLAAGEKGTSVWDIALGYLIETCNHPAPSVRIRVQACDAVSDIIIAAMAHAEQNSMTRQEETQTRVVNNLRELIQSHGHALVDIQRMGLETLNKLLQTSGQSLSFGWGIIFDMIQGSVGPQVPKAVEHSPEQNIATEDETGLQAMATGSSKSTGLVRVAFPCLQLICTDFLSLLNARNLQLCIDTLAAFGYQTEDLNISLTSVGLLWNISDFIQQSMRDLTAETEDPLGEEAHGNEQVHGSGAADDIVLHFPDPKLTHKSLNGLWMLLLYKISTLCSDVRPEVRNGAIQTLLRTIQINASSLDMTAWRQCVWKILLPLLDDIETASCRKVENTPEPVHIGSFVMRHDSPSKQWDETLVLLFNGLADVFQNFLLQLIRLDNYLEAWIFLMEHLETASLFSSPEVAIAALKGMQTMLKIPASQEEGSSQRSLAFVERENRLARLWDTAWCVWERIGSAIVGRDPSLGARRENYTAHGRRMTTRFTQETLTEYVNIMHHLYPILASKFTLNDLRSLLDVLQQVLVFNDSPVYRPDVDYLSPLQLAIHDTLMLLNLELIEGGPAAVLNQLTDQFLLAFRGQSSEINTAAPASTTSTNQTGIVQPTYIALCKVTVSRIVFLLDRFKREKGIYASGVYAKVLKSLGVAMRLRYSCPPSYKHVDDIPLWKMATTAFLECIKHGITIVESLDKDISDAMFLEIWRELVIVCKGTMAPALPIPLTEMSLKHQNMDESFDLVFLNSLKSKVFFRMGYHRVPADILTELIQTLDHAANLYILSTPSMAASTTSSSTLDASRSSSDHAPTHSQSKLADDAVSPGAAHDLQLDIIQGLGITLHSTSNTMVPVRRERFAFACLEILFDLCSATGSQDVLVNQSQGNNGSRNLSNGDTGAPVHNGHGGPFGNTTSSGLELWNRTAKIATPVLMRRCHALLDAYSADQALLGKCPFPRLRHQEISLVLQRLNELQLVLGALDLDQGPRDQTVKGNSNSNRLVHRVY
ncbi:hypothetical protein BGZ68_000897 [Mortierella alpina]|nr:hypothetical protein BGZ68_000897 [Mortierella alpina]